jgi:hypothetical protein
MKVCSFQSTLRNVESRGHEFLLEFEDFYVRVMFALHCQVVGMDGHTFDEILTDRHNLKVVWAVAVKILHPTPVVLLFADHNKLSQYVIIAKVPLAIFVTHLTEQFGGSE